MATIRLGIDSRPAQQGAKQYRDALGRFVTKPSQAAAKGVVRVDRSMQNLRATAGSVKGALGGLFAGFAAVNVLRDATKTITGFEESLAVLQGVSGLDATSDTFQALEARARELGATTAFSAQQAAEGLLFLARAGFTAEEQLAAIGPTLDLATAGGIELGTAADTASNILSQFGLAADQTNRVVDVLVNTANSANTDVTQLGEALKFVGPVAGALGISIEDTAAALGKLGDSGIQASSAGTNLRGILLALESPTSEARARFEELGANFEKLQSSNISERFEELRRIQIDAADAALLFGRRNAAAALILANSADNGAKSLQSLSAANEDSAGTARKNAELIENTLAGSFRSLRSAIEELFLSAGDAGLLGALKEVVDTVTGAIRILAGMEESVTKNKDAAMLLADALKVVGISIAALGALKVAATFLSLAKAILSTVGSVRALSAAFATNPIGLIAIAIGLAITAYQKFKDETFEIGEETVTLGDIVGGIWDFIKDRFIFVANIIGKVWENTVDFLRDAWDRVTKFVLDAWTKLSKLLGIEWQDVIDFVIGLAKFFANTAIAIFKSIGDVIANIVGAIKRAGEALLDFDIGSPIESLKRIGANLDPSEILGNITKDVGANFERDFVGEFTKALPGIREGVKRAIDAEFGAGTFEEFNELFNPLETVNSIRKRALERSRQRVAARAEGSEGDELEDAKKQLEAINAELAKIETGSDVQVNVSVEGAPSLEMAADNAEKLNTNLQEAGEKGKLGVDRLASNFSELGDALNNALVEPFSKESLQQLALNLSDTFTTAIGEVIDGTKSLDEAFKDIVTGVQQAFVENFLLKPLQGIFDNLFNSILQSALGGIGSGFSLFADGDVFSNGQRHYFNRGGVFSSPTTFPLRGGGSGALGEAGPEAILPLERDNTGALGVRSSGGGGSVENNDNRQFNMRFVFPNARNPDDFRPARRQVVRDFERSTRGERVD